MKGVYRIVIESGYGFLGCIISHRKDRRYKRRPPRDFVHDSKLFEANCRNGQRKNQFIVYLLEIER